MDDNEIRPLGERVEEAWAWLRRRPEVLVGALVLLAAAVVIGYWAIWADSSPSWTGFGAYDEQTRGPRAKTLWEWMELLIVPLAVAVGAAVITYFQKKTELDVAKKERENERQIARDRQMQATLESYFDRMTELLLEHGLRESEPNSEVRSIARARTIAVIRSLDWERNAQLITFLRGSALMDARKPVVDLSGGDLSDSDLSESDLSWIDLSGANLGGAKLRWTDLHRANLAGVNFGEADLYSADLSKANLNAANLLGANLDKAYLGSVIGWTFEQLGTAASKSGTFMPDETRLRGLDGKDGLTFEEWKKRHIAEYGEQEAREQLDNHQY